MKSEFPDANPVLIGDILSRAGSAGYEEWWAKVVDSGFCAAPVRLEAKIAHQATEVFARCKNRRASVCPSCSQLYSGDTWRLVHAGIVGDDGRSLATGHPMVFVTLTAPSFGPVHSSGPLIGEPLDPDRYDYVGHVLFTWHAPALWHRFAVGLRRLVVRHCRHRQSDIGARVAYVKVVELQRRAIPHFHAVVRLDEAEGLDAEDLGSLVRQAGSLAAFHVRTRRRALTLRFGEQLDVRALDEPSGRKVARYLAKYVTKSVGDFGLTARRVHDGVIDELPVSNHIRRILRTIAHVAQEPGYRDLGLWMHTLGYRGHITTKTRGFSTTMGELRFRREAWYREQHRSAGETTAAYSDPSAAEWRYMGCGHVTGGERYLAVSAAGRDREMRRAAREALSCEDTHD
jgi:hypothetical protein